MKHRPVPVLAALSGLASVVFLFVGQGLGGPSAPDFTKSRAAHAAWLATHHASTKGDVGDTIELLGILLTIVFAATLWIVLRDGDDTGVVSGTAFGAGIASAAVKLASIPAAFAIYWRADQGFDPQLATALFDMNDAAFVLTWTIDAVMLGAAALVIFRAGVLPRWLGWLGAVAATLSFVSAPFAAKVPPVGMLLTFVWMISVSIVLTRRAVRRDARVAIATA